VHHWQDETEEKGEAEGREVVEANGVGEEREEKGVGEEAVQRVEGKKVVQRVEGRRRVEGGVQGKDDEAKEGPSGPVKKQDVRKEDVRKMDVRKESREEKLRKRWARWLDSEWYGSVVEYRLFGREKEGDGSRTTRKRMERKAADFRLVDSKGSAPRLADVERDGLQSWCFFPDRFNDVLTHAHDFNGHFADAITLKQLVGKFYWPTRAEDTPVFCRSCQNCQSFGPKKLSQQQKPILHLQPLDMIGIDYLGPFNPVCAGTKSKYDILLVDYFSRFAWARAVEHNDGETAAQFLLEEVVKVFGWPSAMYSDNGSHFVQGKLPALLKENGIRHFRAPKSHPSSVGLIEKYVQLILYGLRRNTRPRRRW
jgi:hypothetical protein